jgi:sugar phosphate isomerase/epimerase
MWGVVNSTDGHLARSPHTHIDTAFAAIKALGYEGVEVPFKMALAEPDFKQLLDANGLKVSFVIFTDGPVSPGEEG